MDTLWAQAELLNGQRCEQRGYLSGASRHYRNAMEYACSEEVHQEAKRLHRELRQKRKAMKAAG